jgi:putative endonuclease
MDARRVLGEHGEEEAVRHLVRRGHAILDRNFRTRYGELDVVSATPDCLVFCEVKTRTAGGRRGPARALEAVGPAKRRRLRLMAREWFRLRGGGGERLPRGVRFDAIGVVLDARRQLVALDHVEDAF